MIKLKTKGLFDGYFTKMFKNVYVATSSKTPPSISVPSDMEEYITLLSEKLKENMPPVEYHQESMRVVIPQSKKIMVAFSSGKDCVATAIKFLQKGYEVYLYHLKGVNRSYTQEYDHSKAVAEALGCTFISDTISISGKCDYIENPTRNQFILAMMVDEGLKLGITEYAFGNQLSDTHENVNPEIMCSDNLEFFYAIEKYYQKRISNFKLHTVLEHLTDSYCTVSAYDSELFRLISSCNGPLRFKEHRTKEKQEKFGITLLPGRCGTCYKCANETVTLQLLGVLDYPEEYIQYCKEVMSKWTDKLYNTAPPKWVDEKYIEDFKKVNKDRIKKLEL